VSIVRPRFMGGGGVWTRVVGGGFSPLIHLSTFCKYLAFSRNHTFAGVTLRYKSLTVRKNYFEEPRNRATLARLNRGLLIHPSRGDLVTPAARRRTAPMAARSMKVAIALIAAGAALPLAARAATNVTLLNTALPTVIGTNGAPILTGEISILP
jgi:hypothetical protein